MFSSISNKSCSVVTVQYHGNQLGLSCFKIVCVVQIMLGQSPVLWILLTFPAPFHQLHNWYYTLCAICTEPLWTDPWLKRVDQFTWADIHFKKSTGVE